MPVCAHWTVLLQAPEFPMARAAEPPSSQGISTQEDSEAKGPRPRSPYIGRETVWLKVHPSPSSWDSDSRANLLLLVWGQWLPHSPWHVLWSSSQLSTGEPASYLLLLFLIAKPSPSPSLARDTQQGLGTVAASCWVSRDQMTHTGPAFPAPPFYPADRSYSGKSVV